MEKVIEITAKREGFRRGGIAHSEKTRTYPGDFFKPAVLKALQTEPMLIVVVRNKSDDDGSTSTGDKLQELLDAERNNVSALTTQLENERKNVSTLTAQLEDERKNVGELTAQLEAATKKGK